MSDQEPISLVCPQCEKKLRVPATAAGKRIKCPMCSTVISVPAETGTTAEPPANRPKPRATEPEPDSHDEPARDDDGDVDDDDRRSRRRRRDDDDDMDDDDRPIRRRRKRRSAGSAFKAAAICILVIASLALLLDVISSVLAVAGPEPVVNPGDPPFLQNLQNIQKNSRGPMAAALNGLLAIMALVTIVGSIQMLRQKMWGLALTACLLSAVNIGNCCCVLGLPAGVWGLILLLNQDVKDGFS